MAWLCCLGFFFFPPLVFVVVVAFFWSLVAFAAPPGSQRSSGKGERGLRGAGGCVPAAPHGGGGRWNSIPGGAAAGAEGLFSGCFRAGAVPCHGMTGGDGGGFIPGHRDHACGGQRGSLGPQSLLKRHGRKNQ